MTATTHMALEAKFDALAAPVLPAAQLSRLKDLIGTLESLPHIGALLRSLQRPGRS